MRYRFTEQRYIYKVWAVVAQDRIGRKWLVISDKAKNLRILLKYTIVRYIVLLISLLDYFTFSLTSVYLSLPSDN